MMEKFMVDSVVMWAKLYKVDGFRFDIMGRMLANMEGALPSTLTLEDDGVDGRPSTSMERMNFASGVQPASSTD
jgi:pullulanase/glycogen debranching enzyme